jgi:tetratricopeptide (TPR) repeat protein
MSDEATLQNAYVNMGYASMEQKDFEAAQWYFNKAQLASSDSTTKLNAVLREADAVFMQKGYLRAISLYDRVIAANGADADYAKFQKGIVLGVVGQRAEKMAIMQSLINAVPASSFIYDARYEMALAYIEEDKYQQAITMLMPLSAAYENNSLVPKAWMKIGFCYQQMNLDEKAMEAYRHVVVEYPASDERMSALDALKGLFVDNNRPEAYAQLLKENNIAVSDDNSLDSTYYNAAETQYASGNWVKAKQALGEYLKQYPNGIFATKAHYYKALSHIQRNEMNDALTDFEAVLQKGWSEFAERSAFEAANISLRKPDYTNAMGYYSQLRMYAMAKDKLQEAYMGMMLCSYNLKKYDEAVNYADTVTTLPNVDAAQLKFVSFIKAKSLYEAGKTEEAYSMFKQLTSMQGNIGAEANYYIAEYQFKNNKLKEAEEMANNAIKLSSGNERVTLKTYLLLADILVKQKDYFNAKALLQSIVKNAKIAELKKEASVKLDEIKAIENKQGKLKQD